MIIHITNKQTVLEDYLLLYLNVKLKANAPTMLQIITNYKGKPQLDISVHLVAGGFHAKTPDRVEYISGLFQ